MISIDIPILTDPLNEEQRDMLMQQVTVTYPYKGEVLYKEGDDPDYLYYLQQGHVSIVSEKENGGHRIIRLVEPGAIFGYHQAFTNECYKMTAIAGDNAIVMAFPMSVVFHLIWENSGFAMVFFKDLSSLLGLSVRHTRVLTEKHIRGRLAICLLQLKKTYGTTANGTINIYLSRESIAGITNMTTSNAIRTLSAFADEGLVAIEGRKVRIINEEGLERVAEIC